MIGEIQEYFNTINDLRDQVKQQLEGLSREALDWRPTASDGELATNSMAVIAAHVAGSEPFWIKEIVGGQPIHRDRASEFVTQGVDVSELARGFHETVGSMLAECADRAAELLDLNRVVLSGGCMANRLLVEGIINRLEAVGREVFVHKRVPMGDGGLSLGQAVVAAERCRRDMQCV